MDTYISVVLCLIVAVSRINAHGRLLEPPGRSTAWRFGFPTPTNYNDHELNCGGFAHQWNQNNGRCGLCGDPYDGERTNEAGGVYATGTIVKHYESGSSIDITVQITANHKGWHEFRLCKNDNPERAITQECLDEHLLHEVTTGDTRIFMSSQEAKKFSWVLQLPAGLTCTQCVLQWKWNCGNNWGVDADGAGVGHGPQEQFYGCADIAIDAQNVVDPTTGMETTDSTLDEDKSTTMQETIASDTSTATDNGTHTATSFTMGATDSIPGDDGNTPNQETTISTPTSDPTSSVGSSSTFSTTTADVLDDDNNIPNQETTTSTSVPTSSQSPSKGCYPSLQYAKVTGMTDWCNMHCPNCPSTHCVCGSVPTPRQCSAVGAHRWSAGMNKWCVDNCNHNPPYCPPSHCNCA